MNCPNCGSKIYENDKFCGECGFPIRQTETIKTTDNKSQQHQSSEKMMYFNNVFSFIKRALLEPNKTIEKEETFKLSTSIIAFFTLIFIHTILFFLALFINLTKIGLGYEINFPLGGFISFIFIHILLYAIFFFVTYLLLNIFGSHSQSMLEVLRKYTTTSIVVISIFIVQMFLAFLGTLFGETFANFISGISRFLIVIGSTLFIFSPIYIFLKYVEDRETKLDKFYSILIYMVIATIIIMIFENIFSIILNAMSLDIFINSFDLFNVLY